jgi:hypothetical protein
MSPQKTKPGPATSFFETSDLKQEHKKQTMNNAKKFKEDSVAAANAPMSSCAIIAVLILAAFIVTPYLGVLIFLA